MRPVGVSIFEGKGQVYPKLANQDSGNRKQARGQHSQQPAACWVRRRRWVSRELGGHQGADLPDREAQARRDENRQMAAWVPVSTAYSRVFSGRCAA